MLKLEHVVTHYGALAALRGISIHVGAGQTVALIGANGAGKTTTLLTVSGLLRPSSGQILLDGKSIAGAEPHAIVRQGLVHVPEGRQIFSQLTVRENLLAGAYSCTSRKTVAINLEKIMVRFPRLRERFDQRAGTLSGGEQQMLAIARALMSNPRVLLLDEPSMGLAPIIADQVFALIGEMKTEGMTVLLVEQKTQQALRICDRAYVMVMGEIVASDTGPHMLEDEQIKKAYLGPRSSTASGADVSV
jgi:branched-chain amino acid transport system ATP-binding protein